jgi:SNF2 family DNA or RNA helicase
MLLQAPFRAGILPEPYQMEPLRKALLMPRVNLLIADDVGLGKTIEAGLILRELLLRRRAERCVIAAPPGMLNQWREEMESRFGLQFTILDRAYVSGVRARRGYGASAWETGSFFLISHRLLTEDRYLDGLNSWLGEFCPKSVLILDEAHHAAPASGAVIAIDSDFTHAIRGLAPRFEHRLFLSATPHNGHSNSFTALLEILDPQRFMRRIDITKANRDAVMVRRLKEDVREVQGGFPVRKIEQIDIDGLPADAPELVLSTMLAELRELRELRLSAGPRSARQAGLLVLGTLQQRLLSSIAAFRRTASVHARALERTVPVTQSLAPQQQQLLQSSPDQDDDVETLEAREEDAVEVATAASLTGPAELLTQERGLLQRMIEIADRSVDAPDRRVGWLLDGARDVPGPT